MKKKNKADSGSKKVTLALIKSVLIAVFAELLLVLLFAYLLYQNVCTINLVETLSAVIKLAGAFLAAIMCAVFLKEKRIIFCPVSALLYSAVCFFVLSVFSGELNFSVGTLRDFAFSCGAGIVTALFANFKK